MWVESVVVDIWVGKVIVNKRTGGTGDWHVDQINSEHNYGQGGYWAYVGGQRAGLAGFRISWWVLC